MDAMTEAVSRLEALGNPTRLAIYRYLVRAGLQGRSVGQILAQTDLAASTLSHHLKLLEAVDLIIRRKDGTTHYCCANYPAMDRLIAFLSEECCADGDGPGATRA